MNVNNLHVRRVKVAALQAPVLAFDADTRVDLTAFDGWQSPYPTQKPVCVGLELQISGTNIWQLAANSAALKDLFLGHMLDITQLSVAGGVDLIRGAKGYLRSLFNYLQRGRIEDVRARNLAAPGGAPATYTRTITAMIDFLEPRLRNPFMRCWPVECLVSRQAGSQFLFKLNAAAKQFFVGGSASTLSIVTANTPVVTVWMHIVDVDARDVTMPAIVLESHQVSDTRVNPTPGAGAYLRILGTLSPVNADNYGANGTDVDDLSAYSTIDYFGTPNNYAIWKEDVSLYMRKVARSVSLDPPLLQDDPANGGNAKAQFQLFNPLENFDGHLRAIPFLYPKPGQDVNDARIFADDPKLGANGDSRAGLPASINWATHAVVPRTTAQLLAAINCLRTTRGTAVTNRPKIPPQYSKADPSRVPLSIDLT